MFVFKTEIFDSEFASFSLFLATDEVKQTTCGVLHLLLKEDLTKFRVRLEALRQLAWNPIPVLTLLVELRMVKYPAILTKMRDDVYKIEKTLGTHKNYQHKATHTEWGYYARGDEVWKREGFEESAGELTSLAADCARLESKCRVYLKCLSWIQGLTDELLSKLAVNSDSVMTKLTTAMNIKIGFTRDRLENDMNRSVYLGQRAQIQVQAVSIGLESTLGQEVWHFDTDKFFQ